MTNINETEQCFYDLLEEQKNKSSVIGKGLEIYNEVEKDFMEAANGEQTQEFIKMVFLIKSIGKVNTNYENNVNDKLLYSIFICELVKQWKYQDFFGYLLFFETVKKIKSS